MRVLHVIPSVEERSGGPAAAIVPMCRALRDRGVDVVLATTDHGFSPNEANFEGDYKGVPARFFPVQFGESFKYSRPFAAWLRDNVCAFDLVHVHAVFNHACVAAAAACRDAGVPYVVRPLGTLDPWSMKQKSLQKRIFWTLTGRRMLQSSAAVHYTAVAEKEATEKYLGLNHGRVIALGVEAKPDLNGFKSAAYPPNPYVLSLSRLHPKKGLDVLIDAFLSREPDAWRLVIAGDGPPEYVSLLKKRACDRAGGSERIVFTGWVEGERKERLLRGASLFALPSYQENFGLSALEAMAHGVPVLVTPEVNLAPEIETAKAGWVIGREDLGWGLDGLIKDESDLSKRGEEAYEFAKRYSWEKTAADLINLYEECSTRSHR
ncbi:MAG TPA: glycosyltransferase [Pyrinomonadaceae bacterium]|nr:glycosyltransferase [Pyrinomonadaceae bacterium]